MISSDPDYKTKKYSVSTIVVSPWCRANTKRKKNIEYPSIHVIIRYNKYNNVTKM